MKNYAKILSFAVLVFILGAFAGAVVWMILRIMNLGIDLLWEQLPQQIGLETSLIYNLIVCLTGGLIIGLWQRKYGLLPDNMEQVMGRISKEGHYPYNRMHIIAVSTLLPLIFGGALGPEAGLSGLIAGLCYFVGDKLKYRAHEVAALGETGMAAVMGVVFGAPLFGIIGNLEPDNWKKEERKKLSDKKTRLFIYIMGVLGGILVMMGMTVLLGGGSGLPRFDVQHEMGLQQWKWFPLLLLAGIFFGAVYMVVNKITRAIETLLFPHRVISCMLAGAAVAIIG